MKQRIMTLESSLQKYEMEIQERTKQVRSWIIVYNAFLCVITLICNAL